MTLTDNLPAGYVWTLGGADAASCSINTAPSPDVLSCNFGTLGDDGTRTITLSAPTTGANCAVIPTRPSSTPPTSRQSANGNNSDPGDIDVLCAVIQIEKTANPVGPVNAGDEIGFDIVVSNTGDGIATNVVVTDNLPAGVDWSIDPAVDRLLDRRRRRRRDPDLHEGQPRGRRELHGPHRRCHRRPRLRDGQQHRLRHHGQRRPGLG